MVFSKFWGIMTLSVKKKKKEMRKSLKEVKGGKVDCSRRD